MNTRIAVLLACLCAGAVARAAAQGVDPQQSPLPESAPAPGPQVVLRVEPYLSHHRLTAGFSDWREAGVRVERESSGQLWRAELASMRRFDENGVFLGLGGVYQIDADWYAGLSAGAGDGASYLPRVRVDGYLNRKLLPGRNLVGSLGGGYYRAPDGHVDRSLALGAIYYFALPVVLQGELRFNRSSPGDVRTVRRTVAVTWGRADATQIVARHAWGGEGYQAIGGDATLVNFQSRESSIGLRHRFSQRWAAAIGFERYSNPLYSRRGVTASLLAEFK
jgi:YaiO family outer membrane protein